MSKRDRLIVIGSAALISLALLFGRLPSGFATFTPPAACTATAAAVISAASWNTCITALAAAINSIDNSKVSAGAAIVGSKLDLTSGTGRITSAAGTLTTDGQSGFSVTQTWNNASATFNAALIDITDTTSGNLSRGFVVRVNGTDIFALGKEGRATFNAGVFTGSTGYTFPDNTTQTTAATTMPTGTVAFFNLAGCPTGWTEYTALRGRILVGLPSGGTLAGSNAATALTDVEEFQTNAGTTGANFNALTRAANNLVPTHQLLACSKS